MIGFSSLGVSKNKRYVLICIFQSFKGAILGKTISWEEIDSPIFAGSVDLVDRVAST